jgi:hypothetical protein
MTTFKKPIKGRKSADSEGAGAPNANSNATQLADFTEAVAVCRDGMEGGGRKPPPIVRVIVPGA